MPSYSENKDDALEVLCWCLEIAVPLDKKYARLYASLFLFDHESGPEIEAAKPLMRKVIALAKTKKHISYGDVHALHKELTEASVK